MKPDIQTKEITSILKDILNSLRNIDVQIGVSDLIPFSDEKPKIYFNLDEYNKAILALANNQGRTLLDKYISKGGVIPKT